jgi:hypothetical protein
MALAGGRRPAHRTVSLAADLERLDGSVDCLGQLPLLLPHRAAKSASDVGMLRARSPEAISVEIPHSSSCTQRSSGFFFHTSSP